MNTQALIAAKQVIFHKVEYIVNISLLQSDVLVIEIEEKAVGDRWKGQFSAKYIEEITQKTGNFKKFSVFVKMLTTSLTESSETVHIDLLTYEDLETMKRTVRPETVNNNNNNNNNNHNNAPPSLQLKNKRYLILTYAVEFDRVHYPLPLAFQSSPSPDELKRTIRRLKEELAVCISNKDAGREELEQQCHHLSSKVAAQAEEIDALREQVKECRRLREEVASLKARPMTSSSSSKRVSLEKPRLSSSRPSSVELPAKRGVSAERQRPSPSRLPNSRVEKRASVERQRPSPSRPLSTERSRYTSTNHMTLYGGEGRTPSNGRNTRSVERGRERDKSPASRPPSVRRSVERNKSPSSNRPPSARRSVERNKSPPSRSSSVERRLKASDRDRLYTSKNSSKYQQNSRTALALSDSISESSDGEFDHPDGKNTEISKRLSALQNYLFAQRHKHGTHGIE